MSSRKPSDEMDGLAELSELENLEYENGSFYLGNCHQDHGGNFPIGIKDDRHIFAVAGSRAGKGTTIIINNLIEWPHGIFCIDPKGENASITAMHRASEEDAHGTATKVTKHHGQAVAVLDPLGCVKGPARALRVSYDPLSDININSPEAAAQILAVAESIVVAEAGSGTHFTDSAEIIMAGVIELVLHTQPKNQRNLRRCRELILEGFGEYETTEEGEIIQTGLIEKLDKVKTVVALAQEAYSLLTDTGEEERGSFRSTLSRQLKWMADERMLDHLSDTNISLRQIIRDGGSVYVCIPPLHIPRMKRWLRAIVRVALDTKMEMGTSNQDKKTLFMLDEFPALGHLQIIEDSAGYMAGYGIKLVVIIQNLGQVQKHYGKNWETFVGNAGALIAWGLNDQETEKYFSDRMGLRRSLEASSGTSGGVLMAFGRGSTKNLAWQDRPIRWANQIRYDGARTENRAFVIPADGKPFTVERVNYWNKQSNTDRFEEERYIEEWEAQHGDKIR